MAFSPELFLGSLRTARFGRALRFLAEVDSTIDAAWEWLAEGGPEGGVVIAGRQREGRGRSGRRWEAPEGGVWMSVLARPGLEARHAGRLGMALALAAAEGVEEAAGVRVDLKWPNDLMLAGRKLAGVLVETRLEGGQVFAAVLSVGLNVAVPAAALPQTAVSLHEVTGAENQLEVVAARVLEALERNWGALTGDGAALLEGWRARELWRGAEVQLRVGEEQVAGIYQGVESDGSAALLVAGEGRRSVTVGEMERLRAAR